MSVSYKKIQNVLLFTWLVEQGVPITLVYWVWIVKNRVINKIKNYDFFKNENRIIFFCFLL